MNPLISIIISTYNRAHMLKHSIESVLNQTYSNLEIIISDNASTDNTEEVVESYKIIDKRIKYFRNETNLGMNENWKKACMNMHRVHGYLF